MPGSPRRSPDHAARCGAMWSGGWRPRSGSTGVPGVLGGHEIRHGAEGRQAAAGPEVDRSDRDVAAEQELVLHVPDERVIREVDEQRAHRRQPGLVSDPHLLHDVRAQSFPQEQERPQHLVVLVAERPDLIARAGLLRPDHGARLADSVQPENRREHAELEPADDQLAERWIVDVAVLEAADIRCPPRDAGQADVEASGDLAAQVLEGRVDVTGPDKGAIALAARPGGPAQAKDFLL